MFVFFFFLNSSSCLRNILVTTGHATFSPVFFFTEWENCQKCHARISLPPQLLSLPLISEKLHSSSPHHRHFSISSNCISVEFSFVSFIIDTAHTHRDTHTVRHIPMKKRKKKVTQGAQVIIASPRDIILIDSAS